jgi:tyrosyl-tRNA synthetase
MENLKNIVEKAKVDKLLLIDGETKIYDTYQLLMKFRKEDIRKYIRLKTLIYYFPSIAKIDSYLLERALNNPETVRLVLDEDEYSYKPLDDFYKKKYGTEPYSNEFLTIEEFCEVYGI